MIDRRQTPRSRVFYSGIIAFNERRSAIDCVVRNFSDQGARIELENSALLPDQVDLLIAKKGGAFRATMIWRDARQAGVTFRSITRSEPVPLDWARRLRRCESERSELQSKINQLLSGH